MAIAALTALSFATACRPQQTAPPGSPAVAITFVDLAFQPNTIELTAGQATTLTARNAGVVEHDLQVKVGSQSIHLHARPGQQVNQVVTVREAGSYQFICTIPGHADAGMRGTLTVK